MNCRGASYQESRPCRPLRHGFTLIEVMIVIGIILLLVAITVGVAVGLTAQSEVRQTESTMAILATAVEEWRLQRGRAVTYGVNEEPCGPERYELEQILEAGDSAGGSGGLADALRTTDRYFAILSRNESFRDFIARIDPQFIEQIDEGTAPAGQDPLGGDTSHLEDYGPSFRIYDAWGQPLLVILPGRSFATRCSENAGYGDPDEDGTIRTPKETVFGVARSRRPFFVSAGPDERFGDLFLGLSESALSSLDQEDQLVFDRTRDNLYSEGILIDEARP